MKISYIGKTGSTKGFNATTEHQENIRILNLNELNLGSLIRVSASRVVEDFVHNAPRSINSADKAKTICDETGLEQNSYHHGLAGSALLEAIGDYLSPLRVIASKGDGDKCFNYFFEPSP